MRYIESLQKHYYCPLKDNRQVDDSGGQHPYHRVDSLAWNETELAPGKQIKIRTYAGLPYVGWALPTLPNM
jgi:hypothetical protein